MAKLPTEKLEVEMNYKLVYYLEQMVATGLWGSSVEQCIMWIASDKVRGEIATNRIAFVNYWPRDRK